jgi:putative transposase
MDCKYRPKRRWKAIFGQVRRQRGAIFHALARAKEWQIMDGHLLVDPVHMGIAILPSRASGDRVFER